MAHIFNDVLPYFLFSQTYTVLCVLPMNIFNERIFLFLWFWLIFVAIVTFISLLLWISRIMCRTNRLVLVKKYLKMHSRLVVQVLLNPFPNKPWFLRVCNRSLLKTLREKEKLLVTSNFSFFLRVFYLFEELYVILIKFEIVVCQLFQFGKVLNLSFWKGLINFSLNIEK